MNIIQTEVNALLPAQRKTANKWTSFNAACCTHNGETADRRKRGGVLHSPDGGISYHCFNCGFKTSYRPGRALSYKFKKWLEWMGADDNRIQRLVVEALRIKDLAPVEQQTVQVAKTIEFAARALPEHSATLKQLGLSLALKAEWTENNEMVWDDSLISDQVLSVIDYLGARLTPRAKKYDFYYTEETAYNLHRRVIVPFYWKKQLIGYTARAVTNDVKPKYHSSYESDYVYNMDQQTAERQFVIVVEGPFDAMAVDGVAILGSEVSEQQADIIDSLGKEVIVVPDFDTQTDDRTGKKKWPGRSLIDAALDYGWSVSFPVWHELYKDVADAATHLGDLFVLKSILDARQNNPLKIELQAKQIYNKL
jgi:hypothetical protein